PVPLDAGLAAVLAGWRSICPYNQDADYIFGSPDKGREQPYWPTSAMADHVRPAALRAGITKRLGWHTLRHTFGTLVKSQARTWQPHRRLCDTRAQASRWTSTSKLTPAKREAQSRIVQSIPFRS